MTKRTLTQRLALLALSLLTVLILSACGGDGGKTPSPDDPFFPGEELTFGPWEVTVEPTATESGLLTRVCEQDPLLTETLPLPALSPMDYIYSTTASCSQSGVDTYLFDLDEMTLRFEVYAPQLSHEYENGFCKYCHEEYEEPRARQLVTNGVCGDNLTWTLYLLEGEETEHVLVFSGSGDMYDYHTLYRDGNYHSTMPWEGYASTIVSAEFSEGMTCIGNYAFYRCTRLSELLFDRDSHLTRIGDSAFVYCYNITRLDIPHGVESIGYAAFADCTGIDSLTIPSTLRKMGNIAFSNIMTIDEVYITDLAAWCAIDFGNDVYVSNNNPISKAGTVYLNGTPVTELEIPHGVTAISAYAFWDSKMTSVKLPNTVTSIGDYAFAANFNLTSIHIPSSVTRIGQYAFSRCTRLSTLSFADTANWYMTDSDSYTGGEKISLTDAAANAKTLSDLSFRSYLYKK